VLRTAEALEHRCRSDLLVQISQSLDEGLPLLGMVSFKLLDEAHLDCVRARPASETFPVALVAGFNFGQHGQHLFYVCRQSAAVRLGQGRWFVRRDAWHGKPPSLLFLQAFYTQLGIKNTGCSRNAPQDEAGLRKW
jgi:hypothetical protein